MTTGPPPQRLEFPPHTLCRGGHMQTVAGLYWPSQPVDYQAKSTAIVLPDGDQIALHDDCPPGWDDGDPVVMMLHGLAGCHGSGYMVRSAAELVARGVRTFRMDMRGVGAAAGLARLVPHAGRSEDAAAAVHHIQQVCPDAPITVVGFSMGGNIVLGMLADAGAMGPANIHRAIAVSPPVDLSLCCRELRRGMSRMYDRYLVRLMARNWRDNGCTVPSPAPRSIYEFDDRVTAPNSGYRDAEDYYSHASSGPRLRAIQVQTRILAALDDPIVTFQAIRDAPRSSSVDLWVTDSGGHLGFITAQKNARQSRWMDQQIVEWICEPEW